jgi:NADP-dependent 3-hydroxy acid dehydrogenase YdfG
MSKVALISGGTKGIGKSFVLKLLEEGYKVATFSRNQKNIDQLTKELSQTYSPDNYLLLQSDVQVESSVKKMVEEVVNKFGQIDILINNAGTGYFRDSDQMDLTKFQEMIQTNIVGVALVTKHVVPIMKKNKSGLIINVASISGKVAFANGEFYSATKFGVMGYSQAIRAELAPFGIKVSTICPGMIKTDFFDDEELERRKKIWNGKIPQMLDTSDISRVVSLICSQSEHSDIQDITIMPF